MNLSMGVERIVARLARADGTVPAGRQRQPAAHQDAVLSHGSRRVVGARARSGMNPLKYGEISNL